MKTNNMKSNIYKSLTIALMLFASLGYSQKNLSTTSAVVENFDAMSTGTSTPSNWKVQSSSSPTWTGGTTTGLIAASSGSPATGGLYNWGTSNTERALGVMTSGSFASPNSVMGWYRNTNSANLTKLTISYDLERYRINTAAASVQFYYSLNGTSWTAVTAGDISSSTIGSGSSAYNFSSPTTFSVSSIVISGLNISNNGDIYLRWNLNTTGSSSQGIGIDNVSVTPEFATSGGTPTKLVITSISPSSPVAGNTFNVTVQSQDNSNAIQNVSASTAFSLTTNGNGGTIGGTTTGTIAAGSNQVTVTGVTLSSAGTGVTITATRTSGDVLSAATSSTFTVLDVASQLAFVGIPSSGFTATNLSSFTVEARRPDNTVDVNYTGSITVSKASGPGTLSGTTTATAVAGVATFSTLQFNQAGSYTLNATSGALTNATSSSISIAQTPVSWNFETAAPSAGTPYANLTVSNMSQGNSNGAVTMLSTTSASSGYTGASGNNNAGVAAKIGSLVTGTSGSAYFEFTLTPAAGNYVTLSGISFGSRSTGTGPASFTLLSNKDNYVASVATGTLSTASSWALYTPTVTSTSSGVGSAITFRIYGHGGSGSAGTGTANWRIDDVTLTLNVVACTTPTAFTVTGGGSYCTGSDAPTVGLSGSQSGVNYQLVKDGSNQGSPVAGTGSAISFGSQSASGNYSVLATNTVGLCTATMTGTVTVTQNAVPTAFTVTGGGSYCTGSTAPTVGLSGSQTGISYQLVKDGSNQGSAVSGTGSAISFGTQSAGGDYSVVATNTLTSCSSTMTGTVTVTQNTAPTAFTVTGGGSYCTGSTAPTVGLSGSQTGISYQLLKDGSNQGSAVAGTGTAISFGTQSAGGDYSVVATNTLTSCSSTMTGTVTVTENALPSVNATADNTTVCVGVSTMIHATGATSYSWMPGSLSGADNTVTPNSSTTYTVTGTDNNGCSNTATVAVAVSACGTPYLQPVYCGTVLNSISQLLYYTAIPGATNYRVEVSDPSQPFTTVYVRGGNITDFRLTYMSGIQSGRTYSIRVAAYVGGAWGSYGPACSVTTPAAPAPQLAPSYCGITLTSLSQLLYYTSVPGATNYRIEVTNSTQPLNTVYVRGGNITDFRMSFISGVQYGQTYNLRVAAYIGGVWEAYGSVCTVTTPSVPTSQLAPAYCGITLTSMTQLLYITPVTNATNYRIEVTNTGLSFNTVYVRGGNITDFRMSYITGIQAGQTYELRVAAYVNGAWGIYGPVCTVTTPAAAAFTSNSIDNARITNENQTETGVGFNVFPNPNNGVFSVELEKQTQVIIYNATGQIILDRLMTAGNNEINLTEMPAGIYYVRAVGNNEAFKLIKQ